MMLFFIRYLANCQSISMFAKFDFNGRSQFPFRFLKLLYPFLECAYPFLEQHTKKKTLFAQQVAQQATTSSYIFWKFWFEGKILNWDSFVALPILCHFIQGQLIVGLLKLHPLWWFPLMLIFGQNWWNMMSFVAELWYPGLQNYNIMCEIVGRKGTASLVVITALV